jgi:rhodanese-related sulfurtransferase
MFVVKKISISDLLKLNNLTIIDVRDRDDYELGHMTNAINIPFDDLLIRCEKLLDVNKEYYIYCEYGLRSSRICEFLSDLGYNVNIIDGGYKEWCPLNKKNI